MAVALEAARQQIPRQPPWLMPWISTNCFDMAPIISHGAPAW